mmetsp:Transcript_95052/g.188301  ORF Transcript_95052/g.188301 Transcript_95052/m.188301 type:complete len:96 (+) Transcript_95052:80-367(+)
MPRRRIQILSLVILLGMLLMATRLTTSFVPLPKDVVCTRNVAAQMVTVGRCVAAPWLLASEPAFADANIVPSWPYAVIVVGLLAGVFIVPNTFWR